MRRLSIGLVVLLVAVSCSDDDAATTSSRTGSTVPAATTSEPATATTQSPVGTAPPQVLPAELTVELGADVLMHVEAGLGAVWVTGTRGSAPFLYKIDPDTGLRDAAWELESEPGPGTLSLAVGEDKVWVVLDSTAVRVDPDTGVRDAIDFGSGRVPGSLLEYPVAVTAAGGAAWVLALDQRGDGEPLNRLSKVDADFGTVAAAIVGSVDVGPGEVLDMLVAEGRVWVLLRGLADRCEVVAVGTESLVETARIALSGPCNLSLGTLAAGGGYIYAADYWSGRVRMLDPLAGTEARWVGEGTGMVAYSNGVLWEGSHGDAYALGAVVGTRRGYMESVSVNVYDRRTHDLTVDNDAIWVIVEEPWALLRLVPDQITWGPDPVGEACSASHLNIGGLHYEPDLPVPVDDMRSAIRGAAWRCDFDELAALGLPGAFDWSTGAYSTADPAEHWRLMEYQLDATPLAGILELLALPSAVRYEDGVAVRVWPSAAAYDDWSSVPAADRSALAGLFDPEDLARFANFDQYLGHHLGIDEYGDWRWYVPMGPDFATASLTSAGDLRSDDIVVAAEHGIWIVRNGEVLAGPIDQPTVNAIAAPDGSILYQGLAPDAELDHWPLAMWQWEPVLRTIDPDGRIDILYEGGDQLRLFEISQVPEVAAGPSAVLVRRDDYDGFPYHIDSIVIVPLDGSAPHVVEEVASYETHITGLAWMDGFFAVAFFSGDAFSLFSALDIDGETMLWAANPEPDDLPGVDVTNLTRIGDTSRIAYARSHYDQPDDLVIYDIAAGVEVSSLPVFPSGFMFETIHASNDLIVVSGIERVEDPGRGFAPTPLIVIDAATLMVTEIAVAGTGSVVG